MLKGVIGFTLSRGNPIFEGSRSNPHVCQLHQVDQGVDALFFVFDFSKEQLVVIRSGSIQSINLCPDLARLASRHRYALVNSKV